MDKNLTRQASHRISGATTRFGRSSNSSAHPGQNGGFSDGFLTKRRVDACHSGQPGKSSDPKNPMKSIDYPPSEGYPAHPPSGLLGPILRLCAYSWGILVIWFFCVLHVDPPLTVKMLEIRLKSDHFLSRIGSLNPDLPAIARPHGGSHVLTGFRWHSFRIWQVGAGFPYPIFQRSTSAYEAV